MYSSSVDDAEEVAMLTCPQCGAGVFLVGFTAEERCQGVGPSWTVGQQTFCSKCGEDLQVGLSEDGLWYRPELRGTARKAEHE